MAAVAVVAADEAGPTEGPRTAHEGGPPQDPPAFGRRLNSKEMKDEQGAPEARGSLDLCREPDPSNHVVGMPGDATRGPEGGLAASRSLPGGPGATIIAHLSRRY